MARVPSEKVSGAVLAAAAGAKTGAAGATTASARAGADGLGADLAAGFGLAFDWAAGLAFDADFFLGAVGMWKGQKSRNMIHASASVPCGLFLEAPGQFAVVELDIGRSAGGIRERGARGKKLRHQGAQLGLADGIGQANGLGDGEPGELIAGQIGIFVGQAAIAKGPEQIAQERLGIGRLHPRGDGFDAEEIAAELGDLEAVRVKKLQTIEEEGRRDGIEFEGNRQEEALARDLAGAKLLAQTLEPHALVGSPAIEQDEAGGRLEKSVATMGDAEETPGGIQDFRFTIFDWCGRRGRGDWRRDGRKGRARD
jgi:hypothetical protein